MTTDSDLSRREWIGSILGGLALGFLISLVTDDSQPFWQQLLIIGLASGAAGAIAGRVMLWNRRRRRACEAGDHAWKQEVWGQAGYDVCTRRKCDARRINPSALPPEVPRG